MREQLPFRRLLDLRLGEEVDTEIFAKKQLDLRDRIARLKLQLDVLDRSHDEMTDLAAKVFELSQTLREQWLSADYAAKRRILEIVFLNCRLDDATLVPTIRKPFDVLAEGLFVPSSRPYCQFFEPVIADFADAALQPPSYLRRLHELARECA